MQTDTSIAWRLLLRKIANETLNEAEEKQLNDWLDESPDHRDYFERARRYWLHPETNERPDTELAQFIRRFDNFANQTSRHGNKHQRHYTFYKYTAYAATLLLPVCIYISFLLSSTPKESLANIPSSPSAILPGSNYAQVVLEDGSQITLNGQPDSALTQSEGMSVDVQSGLLVYKTQAGKERKNTLIVPRGGQYAIELSDGSRIWVNADSRLTYPTHFNGNERIVSLQGEAYFQIAKDPAKPFLVRTRQQTIKVYGTSFNVEAYPDEQQERTTLAQGSVGIIFQEKESKLSPNQQAQTDISRDILHIQTVDASKICAWHTGSLSVENERLENILTKLSRWYDVNFTYQNEQLKNLHFTGDLRRYDEFYDLLYMIRMTTSVDFIVNGRQVNVVSR